MGGAGGARGAGGLPPPFGEPISGSGNGTSNGPVDVSTGTTSKIRRLSTSRTEISTNAIAGPSTSTSYANLNPNLNVNPQLGSSPYFAYPTPTSDEMEGELPPHRYDQDANLGVVLDRVVLKGYGDLRELVEKT